MDRASALLDWYRLRRRDFPWRRTRDPWAILTVEVMSQQTQIGRVEAHWRAWMDAFPAPADCAAASPTDVLSLWSGLGYNSRALRLQASASVVADTGWPTTVEGLVALPGVGPYTAAAVACQAFGAQVPTVDTNHRRVISRWLGEPLSGRPLTEVATDLLPVGLAEDWNQALMDLGAGVCTPTPRCGECPVVDWCADPTVYEPPRPQAAYAGSSREARGKVLGALLDGPASVAEVVSAVGLPPGRVRSALDALAEESMVSTDGDRWGVNDAFTSRPAGRPPGVTDGS